MLPIDQVGAGRDKVTGTGVGGRQASPVIPAVPGNATGRSPRTSDKNRNTRRYVKTNDRFLGDPVNFNKFFTIKSPNGADLTKMNLLKADRELYEQLGELEKFNKDNDRKLYIEVRTADQGHKLTTLKKLAGETVEVIPHEQFNQSQDVITSDFLRNYTEEEIAEGFYYLGVRKVYRIKRRNNKGELEPTNTLILTFNTCTPPDKVRIVAGLGERVRMYIPLPRRCYMCQNYGHLRKNCRSDKEICGRCSEDCDQHHTTKTCQKTPKCFHCGLSHYSGSKICSRYTIEKEIIAVKVTDHLTFKEARRIVNARYPKRNLLYSAALQQNNEEQQTATTALTQNPTTNDVATQQRHTYALQGAIPKQTPSVAVPQQQILDPTESPALDGATAAPTEQRLSADPARSLAPGVVSVAPSEQHPPADPTGSLAPGGVSVAPPAQRRQRAHDGSLERPALKNILEQYGSPKLKRGNKRHKSTSPTRNAENPQQKRAKAPSKEKETKTAQPNSKMKISNIPTISGTTQPTNYTEVYNATDDPHLSQINRGTSGHNRTLSEIPRSQHDPGNKDRQRRHSSSKPRWKHK
jgi:hypothetical protein